MKNATLLLSDKVPQHLTQVLHVYQRRKRSVCGWSPPKHKWDREELEQMEIQPDLSEKVEILCPTQWNIERA